MQWLDITSISDQRRNAGGLNMGWGEWGDLPEFWSAAGTTEGDYTDVYSAVAMNHGVGEWDSDRQRWIYDCFINSIGAVRLKSTAPSLGIDGWGCAKHQLTVREISNNANFFLASDPNDPSRMGAVPHVGEEEDYSSVDYILIFLAEQAIGLISAPVAFLWDAAELVANLRSGIDEEYIDTDLFAIFDYPCDENNFIGNWPTDCSFWYWFSVKVNPSKRIQFSVDTTFSAVEYTQFLYWIEHGHIFTIVSPPPNPERMSVTERDIYGIEEISAGEIENYISKYSLSSKKIEQLKKREGKIYLTTSGVTVENKSSTTGKARASIKGNKD